MSSIDFINKIEKIDMTVPAAISFGCATIAVIIHSWPLVIISLIIDILVTLVASTKVINWLKNEFSNSLIP